MQAEADKAIWVPSSVQQQDRTGRPNRIDKANKPEKPNRNNKVEPTEKIEKAGDTKKSKRLIGRLSIPKFRIRRSSTSLSGKTLWDWMPILMQLLGIQPDRCKFHQRNADLKQLPWFYPDESKLCGR
jgi:hypothetical protein